MGLEERGVTEGGGQAPKCRWSLFNIYNSSLLIADRQEMMRGGGVGGR